MKKAVFKYGLISGAISAMLMFITTGLLHDYIGFSAAGYAVGTAGMILSFLLIYPGMAYYRDNVGGGQISYGRALSIGLLIAAVSSVIYVFAWIIVYKTMMPDFMDKYAAYIVDGMKAKGASADKISDKMAEMQKFKEMYKNPVLMFLMTYMEPLPAGILVSVISAFVVRRKKKVV